MVGKTYACVEGTLFHPAKRECLENELVWKDGFCPLLTANNDEDDYEDDDDSGEDDDDENYEDRDDDENVVPRMETDVQEQNKAAKGNNEIVTNHGINKIPSTKTSKVTKEASKKAPKTNEGGATGMKTLDGGAKVGAKATEGGANEVVPSADQMAGIQIKSRQKQNDDERILITPKTAELEDPVSKLPFYIISWL